VGDRIFVGLAGDGGTVTVKATPEDQVALIARAPDTFGVAPRVGRCGWVGVRSTGPTPPSCQLVLDAWRRTAPAQAADRGNRHTVGIRQRRMSHAEHRYVFVTPCAHPVIVDRQF
jgi:hypothetical protein